MLDLKFIREQTEAVKQGLSRKGFKTEIIDQVLSLDEERRRLLQEVEGLKADRNRANDEISKAKRENKSATAVIGQMKALSQNIDIIDRKVVDIGLNVDRIVYSIPNIPDKSVSDGFGANSNKVVREWGKPPKFDFKPKDHLELGTKLGWVSFEKAAKVTGSAFALFQGEGARLVRALVNMMLDLHSKEHGYKEVWPPALVNRT
ncbi:MAG: serine--tRNA ligase, partial [Candidatus Omnitrophica bacterium]|nr:serine--tRNA ligase [Candidatus Omnitrophota bacterium]